MSCPPNRLSQIRSLEVCWADSILSEKIPLSNPLAHPSISDPVLHKTLGLLDTFGLSAVSQPIGPSEVLGRTSCSQAGPTRYSHGKFLRAIHRPTRVSRIQSIIRCLAYSIPSARMQSCNPSARLRFSDIPHVHKPGPLDTLMANSSEQSIGPPEYLGFSPSSDAWPTQYLRLECSLATHRPV
jgi:hypothetical protein